MADGSGRDGYVLAGKQAGRYERPRVMTPTQTVNGVCPRNRPKDQSYAHVHDIISNRVASEAVSPLRYRPKAHFETSVDHSPPKVRVPSREYQSKDRRPPLQLPASPPQRLRTTNQSFNDMAFRGRPPCPRLREAGPVAGFGGHVVGGPR
eukprot:TRINITY_DN12356_c0_g1_i1.p2 TRINITY_DN12356_c0_g1~~TRINITY_DN12356_c0_g1_i1.p2  ORF type:complete len:166 (+),score=29.56 TRINITY_DN12356_c0_g1_i1:50-499(+)